MRLSRPRLFQLALVAILALTLVVGSGCQFLPPLTLPAPPSLRPAPELQPAPEPQPSSPPVDVAPGGPINPDWILPRPGPGAIDGRSSFNSVVRKAAPSVVSIQTESVSYDIFSQAVPQRGAGSGVIIDGRGYVVTNNHVIEGARSVKVSLIDGRVFDAIKVNGDPQIDVAVVEIQGKDLPVAKLGRSEDLLVGDWVVAIGNALALQEGHTVTAGIVSHTNRSIQEPNGVTIYNLIQTDAAINPGNSGGALINLDAEVVGINTAIAGEAQNIGFAIAITPAMSVVEQLIKYGKVSRAWLGVTFTGITPSIVSRFGLSVNEGVILTLVQRGSPADRAGLKAGDVILKFGGEKITKAEQLRQAIQSRRPGDTVDITYLRDNQESSTRATLIETPARQ